MGFFARRAGSGSIDDVAGCAVTGGLEDWKVQQLPHARLLELFNNTPQDKAVRTASEPRSNQFEHVHFVQGFPSTCGSNQIRTRFEPTEGWDFII